MRKSLLSAIFLGSFAGSGLCDPHSGHNSTVKVELVHDFGTTVSLENLAVRKTGEIVVGFDNGPIIYQVEPTVNGTARFIYSFEGYFDIHGITEVAEDQFYVTAGNLSLVTHIDVPGHCAVFHVNMSCFPDHVEVKKVAQFDESRILNGMTVFNRERGLVYVADSRVGIVNLLNVYTGEHFVAINNTLTNQPPGASQISNCVHGVHVIELDETKYLYFSNFAKGIIGRVPIDEKGLAAGEAEVVIDNLDTPEDFIFDRLNPKYIYLAQFESNDIVRINTETKLVTPLVGSANSSTYKWAAAVEFGRTEKDWDDLYFTINGGFLEPDNVGGKVFRIPKVSKLACSD